MLFDQVSTIESRIHLHGKLSYQFLTLASPAHDAFLPVVSPCLFFYSLLLSPNLSATIARILL